MSSPTTTRGWNGWRKKPSGIRRSVSKRVSRGAPCSHSVDPTWFRPPTRGLGDQRWKRHGNDRVKLGEKRRGVELRRTYSNRHHDTVEAARRSRTQQFRHTCHAGGRGFESRRSRKNACKTVCCVALSGG